MKKSWLTCHTSLAHTIYVSCKLWCPIVVHCIVVNWHINAYCFDTLKYHPMHNVHKVSPHAFRIFTGSLNKYVFAWTLIQVQRRSILDKTADSQSWSLDALEYTAETRDVGLHSYSPSDVPLPKRTLTVKPQCMQQATLSQKDHAAYEMWTTIMKIVFLLRWSAQRKFNHLVL